MSAAACYERHQRQEEQELSHAPKMAAIAGTPSVIDVEAEVLKGVYRYPKASLGLARTKTTASQLVSKGSRLDVEAGDVPPLKLVSGHEVEEADRNKRPAANSSLEESFEPPLWDDPLM